MSSCGHKSQRPPRWSQTESSRYRRGRPHVILKKTDLEAVRAANMRIVKNKDGGSTPADIARASRIIIQLKQIELKIESLTDKTLPGKRVVPVQPVFDGPPLIFSLDHLTKKVD